MILVDFELKGTLPTKYSLAQIIREYKEELPNWFSCDDVKVKLVTTSVEGMADITLIVTGKCYDEVEGAIECSDINDALRASIPLYVLIYNSELTTRNRPLV